MPEGSVKIEIRADDKTAAAIAEALARIQNFKGQSEAMGAGLSNASKTARGELMLLGDAIGVRLPREMRSMLLNVPALQAGISAAFNVAGPIAFGAILGEKIVPAVKALADALDISNTRLDAMRKLAVKANEEMGKVLGKVREEIEKNELIGLKGAQLDEKKAAQLREKLIPLTAQMAAAQQFLNEELTKYTELQKLQSAGGVGELALSKQGDTVNAANVAFQKLRGEVAGINAQLTGQAKQGVVDFGKAAEEAAKKATEAWTKYVEKVDKAYLKWAEMIHKIRGDYKMQTVDYGAKVPDNPLISSQYPGGVTLPGQEAGFGDNLAMLQIDPKVVERLAKQLNALNAEAKYLRNTWADFGKEMGDTLKAGLLFGRSWSDVLKTLAIDVFQLILKMTVLRDLQKSVGKGGAGGFFAALLGGFSGFAEGGFVAPNSMAIVGEKGPEILAMGSRGGTIVPNKAMGAGINIEYLDARGSTPGMEANIVRAIQASENRAVTRAVRATHEISARR